MAVTVRRASAQTAYIRFSLPMDEPPGPVSVVGSFNDWTPGAHEMHEDDDGGGRSVIIEIPYGDEVHFRYLADGGRWFDDDGTPTDSEGCIVVAVDDSDEGSDEREPVPAVVVDLNTDPVAVSSRGADTPSAEFPQRAGDEARPTTDRGE